MFTKYNFSDNLFGIDRKNNCFTSFKRHIDLWNHMESIDKGKLKLLETEII